MQLTRQQLAALYIATAAAVAAKFAKDGRASAAPGVAHLAHSYAAANVAEAKLRASVKRKRS